MTVTTLTPAAYYIYQEFLNRKRDPHETNDLLLTHLTPLTVYSLNSEKKIHTDKKKNKTLRNVIERLVSLRVHFK